MVLQLLIIAIFTIVLKLTPCAACYGLILCILVFTLDLTKTQ